MDDRGSVTGVVLKSCLCVRKWLLEQWINQCAWLMVVCIWELIIRLHWLFCKGCFWHCFTHPAFSRCHSLSWWICCCSFKPTVWICRLHPSRFSTIKQSPGAQPGGNWDAETIWTMSWGFILATALAFPNYCSLFAFTNLNGKFNLLLTNLPFAPQ